MSEDRPFGYPQQEAWIRPRNTCQVLHHDKEWNKTDVREFVLPLARDTQQQTTTSIFPRFPTILIHHNITYIYPSVIVLGTIWRGPNIVRYESCSGWHLYDNAQTQNPNVLRPSHVDLRTCSIVRCNICRWPFVPWFLVREVFVSRPVGSNFYTTVICSNESKWQTIRWQWTRHPPFWNLWNRRGHRAERNKIGEGLLKSSIKNETSLPYIPSDR